MINISEKEINKVLNYLSDQSESIIEIIGHTDSLGSKKMNLELSIDRAQTIANFLV